MSEARLLSTKASRWTDEVCRAMSLFVAMTLLLMACAEETPTGLDEQPPTVRIVFPKSNTSVEGMVVIKAEATDDVGVVRVEFYIDDIMRSTKESEPWEHSWETIILENGSRHAIMAKAYDRANNSGSSSAVSVVVNNESNNPPTIAILSPQDSTSYAFGETVTFHGAGWDALGNALRDDQLFWLSSRDGNLGTGSVLSKDNLSPSWHTISLVGTDDRELSSHVSKDIYISTEAELFQLTYSSSDDEYPCWSPDGQRIAYSSYQSGNQDIWIVSAGGGTPSQLTFDPDFDWEPDWHGSEIIFTSFRSGNADIWKISESGGDATQITDQEGWDASPCWSPDGRHIVISSQRGGGPQHLWILSADSAEAQELTTRPGYEPDWYFGDIVFRSGDMNIYVTSFAGMDPIQITWDLARDMSPSWSPEGDAIAFTSDRGGNEDIWVWFFGESRLQQLTFHSGRDYHPAWSPDGQWIAFSSDRNGNADIWLIRAP